MAPQRRAPRASVYALSLVSLAIIFAAFAGTVALRVVLTEQHRTIDELGEQIETARDDQGELRIRAGRLESPDRIRAAALRLGLIAPPEVVYLPPVLPGNPATILPAPIGDPFAPVAPAAAPSGEGS